MVHEPATSRGRRLLGQFKRLSKSKQAELLKQLHDAHHHAHYLPPPRYAFTRQPPSSL